MDRAAWLLSDRLLAGWHGWWRCRKSDGVWLARKGQGVHSRGPQMKWFWEAKKGLEPLTLMADVSLAAMAGVTAADHERISKFCRVTSWSWA